ncbi:MAG: hypothetical protein KGI38_00555 [Thaumarchaeota archaeon]|nr:hypothetical protein [Nitrososphaerota archaeon]
MKADSVELSKFIEAVLTGITEGVSQKFAKDFHLFGNVKFTINIRSETEGGGGVKILVVNAGGKKSKEEYTSVEFEISDTGDWLLKLMERHNQVFMEPDRKRLMELLKIGLEAEKLRLEQSKSQNFSG